MCPVASFCASCQKISDHYDGHSTFVLRYDSSVIRRTPQKESIQAKRTPKSGADSCPRNVRVRHPPENSNEMQSPDRCQRAVLRRAVFGHFPSRLRGESLIFGGFCKGGISKHFPACPRPFGCPACPSANQQNSRQNTNPKKSTNASTNLSINVFNLTTRGPLGKVVKLNDVFYVKLTARHPKTSPQRLDQTLSCWPLPPPLLHRRNASRTAPTSTVPSPAHGASLSADADDMHTSPLRHKKGEARQYDHWPHRKRGC